jgi:hypothetical protein
MINNTEIYTKATSLEEVDSAVQFNVPVGPDHPFFTDFTDVRGDFEEKRVYMTLNVNPRTYKFTPRNGGLNKTLLFLAGMRGSGKTSELAKIAQKLHNSEGFFCVTCNLDEGLDLNDMEYMDILIFQLERLAEELQRIDLKLERGGIASLQKWYEERIKEVNKVIKKSGGFEVEVETSTPSLFSFLKLSAKLKGNLEGSKENAEKIRTAFKKNFSDFSGKFNEFIENVNISLKQKKCGQEILFIIDGLEKVATADIRRKIVDDESNRIRQIKVNTIFTLPIELFSLEAKLRQFSDIVPFPFVKVVEKDGTIVEAAVKRFTEFVLKRIDATVFESASIIREAILHSGGSPRELLRILQYAYLYSDFDEGVISMEAAKKGISKLSAEYSRYLSQADLEVLKEVKEKNDKGAQTSFEPQYLSLLEKLILLEYNDGTYKRVHPLVEVSPLYQQDVG